MRTFSVAIVGAAAAVFAMAAQANGQTAPANAPASPSAAAPSASASDADHDPIPAGAGQDVVLRVCSACHSPSLVATKHLSKDGWHDLVGTMVEHGAQGTDQELAQITDYLAATFPDKPAK